MVALLPTTITKSGATFHPLVVMLLMSDLIFCSFHGKGLFYKSIIIHEFHKLYGGFWCRCFRWRGVVWVAYDLEYVGFEPSIIVTSLSTTNIW